MPPLPIHPYLGGAGVLVDGERTPIGRRPHLGPVPHLSPRPLLDGMLVSAMPTYAPLAAGALHLPVLGSVRHACARQRLVAMSGRCPFERRTVRSRLSPTWPSLVSCTALVDLPGPRNRQTRVASLGSPFPLLAQKVLELVHQLLRVQVVVTPGTRRLVTRRVILLL